MKNSPTPIQKILKNANSIAAEYGRSELLPGVRGRIPASIYAEDYLVIAQSRLSQQLWIGCFCSADERWHGVLDVTEAGEVHFYEAGLTVPDLDIPWEHRLEQIISERKVETKNSEALSDRLLETLTGMPGHVLPDVHEELELLQERAYYSAEWSLSLIEGLKNLNDSTKSLILEALQNER